MDMCFMLSVLTCRGDEKDQEVEEEGEVQHDVGARTTWSG